MKFIGRLALSINFTRMCLRFLMNNKDLLYFPVISMLATIGLFLLILVPYIAIGHGGDYSSFAKTHAELSIVAGGVVLAVCLFVLSMIVLLVNSALIVCVNARLQDQPMGMRQSFSHVFKYWPKLIGWCCISGTVGFVLRSMENSNNLIAGIASWILGFSWVMCTYFVLPFMVLEGIGPIDAIKESSKLFGNKFKKVISVNVVFSVVMIAIIVSFMVLSSLLLREHPLMYPVFIGLYLLFFFGVSAVAGTLSIILRSALYLHCIKNFDPIGFDTQTLGQGLIEKKKRCQ